MADDQSQAETPSTPVADGPGRRRSIPTFVLLLLGGIAAVCGGVCALGVFSGPTPEQQLEAAVVARFADHPVIVEHLGTLDGATYRIGKVGQPVIVALHGSKADAVLHVVYAYDRPMSRGDLGINIKLATLELPDQSSIELLPGDPTTTLRDAMQQQPNPPETPSGATP